MSARIVKVSYDKLMEAIEEVLAYNGSIQENEYIMWADLGLDVDDDGNVEIDVEVAKYESAQEAQEPVDLFAYHGIER